MRTSSENKMTVILIRHGETLGNLQKRYIGRTDEDLCESSLKTLAENTLNGKYPSAGKVFSSPMKRCIETAGIIYPKNELTLDDGLREIDFGLFEGKSYSELSGSFQYQQWIESGGRMPFPEGEDREQFIKRTVSAFNRLISGVVEESESLAFIVHGGTIMSILSFFCGGDYFDYQCRNGEGYIVSVIRSASSLCFSEVRRL